MDNIIFIDVQGFKSNSNRFIVKELAIVFNNDECINFIIKPPYDFKCLSIKKQNEANWLTKNYHHINWNDGSASYKNVCNFVKINTKHSKIYTKGREKKKWLEEMIHQTINNIEDICSYNFKQMENKYAEYCYCNYHTYGVCAQKNAFLMSKEFISLT